MTAQLQYVGLGKIKVKDRTREDFGDMQGLVESIRDKGIIVPLIINKKMELLAGGRRYDASLQAGLKEVPVIIRETSEQLDGLEIELIENVFRKDFTWQENSAHIKKLHDYCAENKIDWSARKTAQLIGESEKGVSRARALAEAVEQMPELAKLKTQDEAEKVIKKLHEHVVIGELRRRQDEGKQSRGIRDTIKIAKANYNVGDCFKGMAELRTNGLVHFIELDPPYAIDLADAKKKPAANVKEYNEIPSSEYEKFMSRMAMETYRVAHHHSWMICWFGPTHFTLVKDALVKAKWTVCDIPGLWVKPSGQTMAPEYNLANCYEPFFVCRKGQPALVQRGRSNVFNFDPVPPQSKYHPTERPMELITELLSVFTMPSQVCMVPCLGSGKTLRACYLAGLTCFGYDLSDKYKDKFLLGVEEDTKQLDMEE